MDTPSLLIKKSLLHGYGVFANVPIEKNSIIEKCHVIICSGKDDSLKNYYFQVDDVYFIPSGYSLLYNHADNPNSSYYFDAAQHLLVITALRKIQPGEEILIHYGKTWFSDRNMAVKKIPPWRKCLRFTAGVPLRTTLIATALLLAIQWLHVLVAR